MDLRAIARQFLQQYGFLTDFPADALGQAAKAAEPDFSRPGIVDRSAWLWSSIDNDDSRDLDQIEYIETRDNGFHVAIGIANVDYFLPKNSPIDAAAAHNTTSIYMGVETFPMLPERLSTNLSSLLEGQKRLAMVMEFDVASDGTLKGAEVYPAIVQNKAQLTYNAVAAWLEAAAAKPPSGGSEVTGRMLGKINASAALQEQLRRQDQAATALRQRRHQAGALSFVTSELRPQILADGQVHVEVAQANRATRLIEDFMIAANQTVVGYLEAQKFPTLRRVVRTPKRWDRIMQLAAERGSALPAEPDSVALEGFLMDQERKDADHFPDLSLAVIKLLGRGEYVVQKAGESAPGHFGLAVDNYAHSTAPNRRYPDVLTQRLLLAATGRSACPYAPEELQSLATHCTQKEDDANKAERAVHKCAAAQALSPQIGQLFDGFITGASDKGVWVRLKTLPIEGKVLGPARNIDVGDRVQVKLVSTDARRGYIDFELLRRI